MFTSPPAFMPLPISEGAEDGIYMSSFGNLPNHTVYLDRLQRYGATGEQFLDKREEVKAALVTTSPLFAIGTKFSGTSGSTPVLLPTIVDDKLYDLTIRDTPLASGMIPRTTNRGVFADFIKRTAIPSGKWEGELATGATQASTYTRDAKKIKFMRTTGEISGPMLVASEQQWKNILTIEVAAHQRGIKEKEEDTIINGSPTTGTVDGGVTDQDAFEGFISLVTTNYEDLNDAEIKISNITNGLTKIREAKGHPNLMVTDYTTLNVLKGEMYNLLRYPAPSANIAFGISSITFEDIPVIPDLFMPTTDNAREFHIWDTQTENNVQMRVLQEMTYTELAKTTDTTKFMVKEYLRMLMIYESWCHRIYDIS